MISLGSVALSMLLRASEASAELRNAGEKELQSHDEQGLL